MNMMDLRVWIDRRIEALEKEGFKMNFNRIRRDELRKIQKVIGK